jgi:hypothetical protein
MTFPAMVGVTRPHGRDVGTGRNGEWLTVRTQQACRCSQSVQYSMYAGATHDMIPVVAQNEYVQWIADRFAGKPVPTNCSSPTGTPPQ